jgi:NodT family efflux transporter outer membrane factor (OMF) lipoprotein
MRAGLLAPALLALLAACAVGPDFRRPAPPEGSAYLEKTPGDAAGGSLGSQRFSALEPEREWWTGLHSPELDALVAGAFAANPGLLGAKATLRAANENLAAQRGAYFPQLALAAGASRERQPVTVLSPTLTSGASVFNLYTPALSVSFVPDLFGANRRAVESQAAAREIAACELEAAYETLAANVATAAFSLAGNRAAVAATEAAIAAERDILAIDERALALGAIAPADLYAQESALATLEATLPALAKQQAQGEHQLAMLLGRRPDQGLPALPELARIALPAEVPLGLPARLVERRPDVRAAEAALHQASAAVGIAIADMLPSLTLSAGAGSTASSLAGLFKSESAFWSAGASLSQTLFAGGTLYHRKKATEAELDAAGEAYRGAVLNAFQNVADALSALVADAEGERAAERAEQAAAKSLALAKHQRELGALDGAGLLLAEAGYQQALALAVAARTSRYLDTAALYLALGGAAP